MFDGVLDRMGAWATRLCYLLGMVLGVRAFFAHSATDFPYFQAIFTWAIAGAVMIHELLLTRRVQSYTAQLAKKTLGDEERQVVSDQRRLSAIVMVALLAFCGFSFWANQTNIHDGAEVVPFWLSILVEAVVLPIFAWSSTWLIEVKPDPEAILQKGAYRVLHAASKTTVKQWRKRIKAASKEGRNLSGIQTRLLIEAGDDVSAARIAIIEEGLRATTAGEVVKTSDLYGLQSRINSALGGSSLYQGKSQAKLTSGSSQGLTSPTSQNEPSNGSQNRGGRKPRKPVKLTEQQRVFAYLDRNPNASLGDIEMKARVTRPTAIKHKRSYEELHTLTERTGTEG
jgi:hypothetical protein